MKTAVSTGPSNLITVSKKVYIAIRILAHGCNTSGAHRLTSGINTCAVVESIPNSSKVVRQSAVETTTRSSRSSRPFSMQGNTRSIATPAPRKAHTAGIRTKNAFRTSQS